MHKIFMLWIFGRFIEGINGVFEPFFVENLWTDLLKNDDSLVGLVGPGLLVLDAFLSEILPMMTVVESSVIKLFAMKSELKDELSDDQSKRNDLEENFISFEEGA